MAKAKKAKAEKAEKVETPQMRYLRQIGTFLFGKRFQSDFARAIKLDLREMRYCIVGGRELRLSYWKAIKALLVKRKEQQDEKVDDLLSKVEGMIEKLSRREEREERSRAAA
jgi:hypothetical protein